MNVGDKGTRRKENGNEAEEQNWKLILFLSFNEKETCESQEKKKRNDPYTYEETIVTPRLDVDIGPLDL